MCEMHANDSDLGQTELNELEQGNNDKYRNEQSVILIKECDPEAAD